MADKQIHLRKTARKLMAALRSKGFGGITFDTARVHEEKDTDFPGEISKRNFKVREKHYVVLEIVPDFGDRFGGVESQYVERMVDEEGFWRDLKAHIVKAFGPGVVIDSSRRQEWECYRDEAHGGRYYWKHFRKTVGSA